MFQYGNYKTILSAQSSERGSSLWKEAIKSFFIVLLIVVLSDGLATLINDHLLGGRVQEPHYSILYLFEQIIPIVATLLYCLLIERRSLLSMGIETEHLSSIGKGLLCGAGLFSAVVIIGLICNAFEYRSFNRDNNLFIQVLFFIGFFIQGFSEELICRGYVFISMTRKNSVWGSAIVSSLMFSFLHVFNDGFGILPLLNLILFGLFEALCFLKYDSIWFAAAVHSMWNYVQGNVYGFSVSGSEVLSSFFTFSQTGKSVLDGGLFGPEGGIIVSIILVICIIYSVFSARKELDNGSV